MQDNGNNFNNQNGFENGPQDGFNEAPNNQQSGDSQLGPGGYEYRQEEFSSGQNYGQNGYGQNGYGQPGGFGQGPEGNRIILESCYNLRRLAREALRGKWVTAAVAAVIVTLLLSIPTLLIDNLFGIEVPLDTLMQQYGIDTMGMEQQFAAVTVKSSPLSALYGLLVTGPLTFGLTAYFLILFRRGKENYGDLFSGFEFFGKTLGLFLWIALWVILWAIIPLAGPVLAIIAGLRYSMAFMVQVDNPSLPIRDCLNRSKFMMKGNKGKLFLLTLSFLGWLILAALPGAILGGIVGAFTTSYVALLLVEIIGNFVTAFVMAYMMTAEMAFYDMLIGRIFGESYIPGRY